MLPINTIGSNTSKSTQMMMDNVRASMLMTICAQRYPPMTAKIHKGNAIFQIIFFSFQNLAIAHSAFHTPANLLVAIAACGGNHKSMSAGATMSPAPHEIAERVPATRPNKNIKKII